MARAIDAVRFGEIMEQWKKDCLADNDTQGADIISDVILQLDDMPTITPPNDWVSVEERLPKEKQRVIVRCEHVGTSVGWILWGRWMTDIGPHAGDVTHWMLLPAPPDKDNNVPAKTQNEPLTLEQLRESPHGKIKDSTLQSICNRANEIACRPPEGEV